MSSLLPRSTPVDADGEIRFFSLYFRIRTERISWLRFILEGYDGLALLSTVSQHSGLVRLRLPACSLLEAMRLMQALASGLSPYSTQPHIAAPKQGVGVYEAQG